jgi:hypothetical protein
VSPGSWSLRKKPRRRCLPQDISNKRFGLHQVNAKNIGIRLAKKNIKFFLFFSLMTSIFGLGNMITKIFPKKIPKIKAEEKI